MPAREDASSNNLASAGLRSTLTITFICILCHPVVWFFPACVDVLVRVWRSKYDIQISEWYWTVFSQSARTHAGIKSIEADDKVVSPQNTATKPVSAAFQELSIQPRFTAPAFTSTLLAHLILEALTRPVLLPQGYQENTSLSGTIKMVCQVFTLLSVTHIVFSERCVTV